MQKESIQIIPVRTFGAGNMGSILRAMKNFDFTRITAVNSLFTNTEETEKLAAGAKDHLNYLKRSDNLKSVVASSQRVYAFSARKRKGYATVTPREMAEEIARMRGNTEVALLFGNETNGLSSEEMDCADTIVIAPTSKEYGSLNLAAAVLLALYEISVALEDSQRGTEEIATNQSYKQELLESCEDLIEGVSPQLLKTKQFHDNLKAVFRKMHLSKKESRFLTTLVRMLKQKILR